jgi:cell division protein DivIC
MAKNLSAKERQRIVLTSILCFFIIGLCLASSIGNAFKIINKNKEKEALTIRLEELKEEEKKLSDDVVKLKNPEYAARYARERYLYSKTGEKILKID